MFDSTDHLTPETINKLERISRVDYLSNTLEIFLDASLRIEKTKLSEGMKHTAVRLLGWSILKIKKTFTDEVVSAWELANQNRTWLNCFRAMRVTAVTTRAWIAG